MNAVYVDDQCKPVLTPLRTNSVAGDLGSALSI